MENDKGFVGTNKIFQVEWERVLDMLLLFLWYVDLGE